MESAVVSASEGAMATLLEKLGDLLTDKYKLFKEAKELIIFFKHELESMHVFLKKMSDMEEPDDQDKCWAKEIRELSYDIEDSVNEYLHHVERECSSKTDGLKGFIDRIKNLWTAIMSRHEIAKELQGHKRRVIEVSERRMRYKVDDDVPKLSNTTIDPRVLAIYVETSVLVGIEGPREEVIQLIDDEAVPADQLKVLSIVGFGGLGKTTLANQIYRKLEGQFNCRSFISVSQKPDIRKVLRTVLSQVGFLDHERTMEWDEIALITALRNFLLDKRYLIVIDDIWDVSAWEFIRPALQENMNGSRVITTTRIESVARACCAGHPEYVYKMKPLSDQDSRRLFFTRVFRSEDACPSYLKEISAEILKKCGGLPLAINTTSSLLASQPNDLKEHWEYVRKCLGSNPNVKQILNLSYINLPHYLKTCILYLGIYPEDYTIDKNDLVRQWVAAGFINKIHGMDPEDVAKSYFNELINRNMIQPTDANCNGEVMSCRVHDIMLELILEKCREENFVTVTDDIQDMTRQQDKIRRLSLHLDGAIDEAMGPLQLLQTRTLGRFGTSSYLPPFLLMKHLQVLTVEMSQVSMSPLIDITGICHLFQLRYFKIVAHSHRDILLPDKFGDLRQLETFHLQIGGRSSNRPSLRELPSDIIHMSRLLHLIIPYWIRLPDGIGNMKSLRTLNCFNLGTNSLDNIKALRELSSLTDLQIKCFPDPIGSLSGQEKVARWTQVMRTCLENLSNLKCLALMALTYLDVPDLVPASLNQLQSFDGSMVLTVPKWIPELSNLYRLSLQVRELLVDDFGMLAQLPSLKSLRLHIQRTPGDKIIVRRSAFLVLKHLALSGKNLLCLALEAGAMAKLERLELNFNVNRWDSYSNVPTGMEHLSAIKEISVEINHLFAEESDRRAAESALRNAFDMHPTANIYCSRSAYAF